VSRKNWVRNLKVGEEKDGLVGAEVDCLTQYFWGVWPGPGKTPSACCTKVRKSCDKGAEAKERGSNFVVERGEQGIRKKGGGWGPEWAEWANESYFSYFVTAFRQRNSKTRGVKETSCGGKGRREEKRGSECG